MPLRSIRRSPKIAVHWKDYRKQKARHNGEPSQKNLCNTQNRPGRSSMLCTPPATLRPVWPWTLSG